MNKKRVITIGGHRLPSIHNAIRDDLVEEHLRLIEEREETELDLHFATGLRYVHLCGRLLKLGARLLKIARQLTPAEAIEITRRRDEHIIGRGWK